MITSTEIKVLIILAILILAIAITLYIGVGFILSVASQEDGDRKYRFSVIFGWPALVIKYLIKGPPKTS